MADWTLKQQWSLNGHVVPLAEGKANIEDHWNLTESGDRPNVDLFFLNLKATAGPWMDKALQLKCKAWYYHSGTLPFLQEVKEAITKAQAEFAFLRQRDMIVIQIREKVLKVHNDLRSVRLAFERTEIEEKFIWCLSEIKKDIEVSEPRDPGAPKVEKQSIDGVEAMHLEACLRALKAHDGCFTAVFCESRRSFKVKRKDNIEKQYCVLGLSKKRKLLKAYRGLEEELPDKDFEDLEKSFWKAVAQARDWLDGCPMACLKP